MIRRRFVWDFRDRGVAYQRESVWYQRGWRVVSASVLYEFRIEASCFSEKACGISADCSEISIEVRCINEKACGISEKAWRFNAMACGISEDGWQNFRLRRGVSARKRVVSARNATKILD